MTTTQKEQPAFFVFATGEDGKDKIIGRAYRHKKGDGLNLLIDGKRYKAFPLKVKPETEISSEEGGA